MYQFHIADDHPLFRNALLDVLHTHFPEAENTESANLDDALAAPKANPDLDLLLLDINMPGSQDLFGLICVRKQYPDIPVVMVSAWQDKEIISRAMGHGASGYIPKSMPSESIAEAITAVLNGEHWVPPSVRSQLHRPDPQVVDLADRIASLTPQQYKVLCALREGQLNKQIAYDLGITEATIKAHITAIFRKLGVSNRTQAVIMLSKMALNESAEIPQ